MAAIEVKYDPTLQLEPIVDAMYATKNEDNPQEELYGGNQYVDQTKITGIAAPLIAYDGNVIQWSEIKSFYLSCETLLPRVSIIASDSNGIFKGLTRPSKDNILRVQILPPFEDAYKKIDLPFYVTQFSYNGTTMMLDGIYHVPELRNCRLEAFGEITTYELIDKIAKACQLGLASNISDSQDKRWIYCQNESYRDLIKREIVWSGGENQILDCWVDWHNYLNFVDLYDRYNSKEEGLKVWTTTTSNIDVDIDATIEPAQVDAIITNHPSIRQSQLHINNYTPLSNTSKNVREGTDKIVEVYNINNCESSSVLIQDGDAHNDIFTKTIYGGENFGEFNYLLQKSCRDAYIQKMNDTMMVVTLAQPVLGFERGGKVDLRWFDTNDILNDAKANNPIDTNIPADDDIEPESFVINKQVSGQYYIYKTELRFEGVKAQSTGWKYKLWLCRPQEETNAYKKEQ